MTARLFAEATMLLEDMHGVAVDGQRPDVPPDLARALVAQLRGCVAALDTILAQIAARLA